MEKFTEGLLNYYTKPSVIFSIMAVAVEPVFTIYARN